MATETKPAGTWDISNDALEFARRTGLEQHIGPLTEALDRIFPGARVRKLSREEERDLPHGHVLVFDVIVTDADLPTTADDLAATKAWHQESRRIVPGDAIFYFPMRLQYAEE